MISKDNFWSSVLAAGGIGELSTGDAVFDRRARCVWRVLEGGLIAATDVAQVECWEDVLELVPGAGLPLVERKAAVLRVLCEELPFTVALLPGRLRQLLGEGNFTVTQGDDGVRVALGLETTAAQVEEVKAMVGRVLPRNLETEILWADGLPVSYERLEYLESMGTQYINTAITVTSDSEITIDVMPMKYGSDEGLNDGLNTNMIYGNDNDGSVLGHFVSFNYNGGYGGQTYVKYGSVRKYMGAGSKLEKGRRYVLQQIKEQFYIDNKLFGEFPYSEFTDASTLIIFGVINNQNRYFYGSRIRVYGFSLKDDSQEINFIPALDPITKQPGMYDTVNKVFKINSGAGDFTYPGAETQATTYSLRNRMYGKITEHGIRRLYRVPEGYGSKEEYAAEHGYKLMVETPVPEEGCWSPVWHDREDCIELEWVECEPPAEAAEGEVTEN